MSIQESRKEYEKIKVKYKLPSFDYLDEEFEISSIKMEEQGVFIKALLRLIANKVYSFLSMLESVVDHSHQTMHDMIEKSNINDQEKQEIFVLYKELGKIYHELYLKSLQSEKDIADYLNLLFKKWPKIKERQIIFTKLIVAAWEKE